MKVQSYIIFVLILLLCTTGMGCGWIAKPVMPQMDLPPEVQKPKIEWKTTQLNGNQIIYLPMGQGLALLEYLIRLDVQAHEYRYRIETMNKLMVK